MEMFGNKIAALLKIRKIADYQFGKGQGEILFSDDVNIVFSKKTGRIRYIYLHKKLLATLNPKHGFFSLTLEGAKKRYKSDIGKRLWVQVSDEISYFVERGSDVFAKHVINVDEAIRPLEEVVLINGKKEVIAVGRSKLTGKEMKNFRKGVAVKVRKGRVKKKIKKEI
jgi:predicted RNA-binding protein (TIGR00451 family)